jgi:hypothetical protein
MKEIATIGIDLERNVFQIHGVEMQGRTVLILSAFGCRGWVDLASFTGGSRWVGHSSSGGCWSPR